MPSHKQTLFYIALPFIAFFGLIVYSAIGAMGPHFTLPVQGYDPRNVLYGHYMNLRINSSVREELKECACIDAASTITYMSCKQAEKESCIAVLDNNNDKHIQSLSERIELYIDETTAPTLEAAMRENPKRLAIDATMNNDVIVVHGLLLDGKPVKMMDNPNPFEKLVK